MIDLNGESAKHYLAESQEHLTTLEMELLDMEESGAVPDEESVNRALQAIHSVEGGAASFDLVKIGDLAHRTEDVMALLRSHALTPTRDRVGILLRATDQLRELVENPHESNQADVAEITDALAGMQASAIEKAPASGGNRLSGGRRLRMLLVEDDFASRLLLQTLLSRYGECHVAVNGKEAVEAFRSALEREEKYDLICMDIMMPEMDGREAVRQIRDLETERGILSGNTKIIMTTAVDDMKEVIGCFRDLCDAYLVKPIDLSKLLGHMKSYQLIQ